jgi:hypothetical protein
MLTNSQMSWCLLQMLPGTQNGREYLVGQETDMQGVQTAEAKIYQWNMPNTVQPSQQQIKAYWDLFGHKYLALVAQAGARDKRSTLLAEADILINKALDNGQDATALRAYRQALRDITTQTGFPQDVQWPELPA